jgi:drug/metabolite transporter (DMT)-like permease
VLSSVLVLGEDLGGATLAGGAAILAGLWLVQRPGSVKASRFSARALQTD